MNIIFTFNEPHQNYLAHFVVRCALASHQIPAHSLDTLTSPNSTQSAPLLLQPLVVLITLTLPACLRLSCLRAQAEPTAEARALFAARAHLPIRRRRVNAVFGAPAINVGFCDAPFFGLCALPSYWPGWQLRPQRRYWCLGRGWRAAAARRGDPDGSCGPCGRVRVVERCAVACLQSVCDAAKNDEPSGTVSRVYNVL